MEQMGYGVKWLPNYKYITYTTPQGQNDAQRHKCRDNRLHEEKYLKERMEGFFNAKYRGFEEAQQPDGNAEPAIYAADLRDTERAMGGHAPVDDRNGTHAARTDKHRQQAPDRTESGADDAGFSPEYIPGTDQCAEQPDSGDGPEKRKLVGHDLSGFDGGLGSEDNGDRQEIGEYAPTPGYVGAKAQSKVVRSGEPVLGDIVSLAKAVEDMVNPYDPETERQKKKAMAKKQNSRRKKIHDHSDDYDISL
jgi:hypothetical protein